MKWMIASDLHGSAFYCKKMLEAFERERADRLLLLGLILLLMSEGADRMLILAVVYTML